jgi:hypothetical protein
MKQCHGLLTSRSMTKVMKAGFNVFSEADVEVLLEVLARRFENQGEAVEDTRA